MRIVYISDIFPDQSRGIGVWGGGEKQFYEVSRRVARMGHEVFVVTSRFPGQPARELVEGIWVLRHGTAREPRTGGPPSSPFGLTQYLLESTKATVAVSPNLIHCNSFFAVFPGRVASRLLNVPMVTTLHDVWGMDESATIFGSPVLGAAGYATSALAVKMAGTEVIAVSSRTKAKLTALGVSAAVTVIPNGVDHVLLDATSQMRAGRRVLYVGRLVWQKRVDVLIRAFAKVVQQEKRAELKIVGDGPEGGRLRDLARELGLADREIFVGTLARYDAVAECFKQSDLFVFPSISEGEGIALKEAMAASLPVIAADAPGSGVLSLVRDGWNGRLVPPGDDSVLAACILDLLARPQERERLATNGRKFVEESSWDSVASRTLGVYERALHGGGFNSFTSGNRPPLSERP